MGTFASVGKSFQLSLTEPLIGWILLIVLFLKNSHFPLSIFLCGALLSELATVFIGCKVPNIRDSGSLTGAWLIAPIPMIISHHDVTTSLNLICASLGVFILVIYLYHPGRSTIVFLLLWFICARIAHLVLDFIFLFTFLFLGFLSLELLSSYPKSFTVWESILLAQICFIFHINTTCFLFPLLCAYAVERFKMPPTWETFGMLLPATLWLWSLLSEYLDQFVDEALYSDSIYPPSLHCDFVQIIMDLITPMNLLLIITLWIPLCILAVLVVGVFGQQGKTGTKTPFALRKFFHLLAGVVYSTGLLVSPRLLSIAAACVLLLFLLLEWTRRRGSTAASRLLNDALRPFRDSRDSGDLVFTPIALLLGLSLPIWNFGYLSPDAIPPQLWSGVITIALGDSVAALVGRQWGHLWFRWPGTHRTLMGSLASLVSQLLLWLGLAALFGWPWRSGLLPLAISVFVEAYTEQIDNLTIPLLFMSLLPSSNA